MDLKIAGLSKLIDDRVAVSETRVTVAENLLDQLSASTRRLGSRELKQSKAGETLLTAVQKKLEEIENENIELRLENQTLTINKRGLEKELESSKLALVKLKATFEESFVAANANKTADLENGLFKLKIENSALLDERNRLEERLKFMTAEKQKAENNLDEIRGKYEQEVTNLKIQLKNTSFKFSKSKFCSTTNLNQEKQTDMTQQQSGSKSKSQFPSANESLPKQSPKVALERQDSFAKQSWSDIKDMLHAKQDARIEKMNTGKSQTQTLKSKRSSSSSNNEEELIHDPGSESSSEDKKPRAPVETSINNSSTNHCIPLLKPIHAKSAQNLPVINLIRSSPTSPTRFIHQSMDEYRDRFERANMTIDTLKCEMTTLETRLRKKDEAIAELKKQLEVSKSHIAARQAEKESLREELVNCQKQLIVIRCELDDLRTGHVDGSDNINLKAEIEKLKARNKVEQD